jgi:hypothetical protein
MMMMIGGLAYTTQCGTRNPIGSYVQTNGGYVSVHLLETKYLTKKLQTWNLILHMQPHTHIGN